jgi:hypothetical protein
VPKPKPPAPEASRITDLGLTSGSKHRYHVVLTESELDMARRMGVSAEQYAIEMIRREQEEARPK